MSARLLRHALAMAGLLLGGAALAADPADAASARAARIARVADQVVVMLPIGAVFDEAAAKDATWPVGDKGASKVPADQLKCLRGEMSSAGYRRQRVLQVQDYYRNVSDDQVANDVRVLDAGAAAVMGRFIEAGFQAMRTGAKVDQAAALKGVTGAQMAAMMEFSQSPDFAGLRRLSGLGEALGDQSGSNANSEARGKSVGATMVTSYMFKAMDICAIPPASLL